MIYRKNTIRVGLVNGLDASWVYGNKMYKSIFGPEAKRGKINGIKKTP
jgi:hypothetical protein